MPAAPLPAEAALAPLEPPDAPRLDPRRHVPSRRAYEVSASLLEPGSGPLTIQVIRPPTLPRLGATPYLSDISSLSAVDRAGRADTSAAHPFQVPAARPRRMRSRTDASATVESSRSDGGDSLTAPEVSHRGTSMVRIQMDAPNKTPC